MANIKVDHSKLSAASNQIHDYINKHKTSMNRMGESVFYLVKDWNGEDYNQLLKEWAEINVPTSTSGLMIKTLELYADSLKSAAGIYKEAQSSAVNRANSLCR